MNIVALVYGLGAIVNMSWPRSPQRSLVQQLRGDRPTATVMVLGLIYMAAAKPYDHGTAPAGDAHRLHASSVNRALRREADVVS